MKSLYPKNNKSGFTLIETMVAISILVLATLGPLSVASQGLRQAQFARDQVTAYYLADEAVEFIRNVRDNNAINARPWAYDLDDCTLNDGACTIDATKDVSAQAINRCPSVTTCPPLETDSSGTFFYSSVNGQPSIFTRTITMTPFTINNAVDEYKIIVTMTWNTAGIKKTFTLTENINNINKVL